MEHITSKELLQTIVCAIVEKTEEVKIDERVDEMGLLLTLSVAKEDMGKVIGKGGVTAQAIRTLLRVAGVRDSARVNLKIDEPEGSERSQASEVRSEPVAA